MSGPSKLSRRNFLLAAGAGGAAAATVLVAGKGAEQSGAKQKKHAASQGYRLTEHIRNYYRTTQV